MTLPKFHAPEPFPLERIEQWHRRVIDQLEIYVNEELAPALRKQMLERLAASVPTG